jgi:DNA-binding MarR family transcriptional regulator
MNTESSNPRKFEDGEWYWLHKEVLKGHAATIKPVGLAVYNVLASMVNRDQECYPSQRYIADLLGYSRASVSRAIEALSGAQLISIERRKGTSCTYRLVKLSGITSATKKSHRRKRVVSLADTNNKEITIRNNNRAENGFYPAADGDIPLNEGAKTKEELLAYDLAKALDDLKSIRSYVGYAQQYPESFLRRILSEVKSVPSAKIKKSRAALFHYLLRING